MTNIEYWIESYVLYVAVLQYIALTNKSVETEMVLFLCNYNFICLIFFDVRFYLSSDGTVELHTDNRLYFIFHP